MDNTNLQIIRESFGRVVYSHKTHEKEAERFSSSAIRTKWINIILTSLTSGTLISTIITSQTLLAYVSAALATITLAFIIFQLSFNPEEKAEKHRQTAKELWLLREKYTNLIADIVSGKIDSEAIILKRDDLLEKLCIVYKFAPNTSPKAYQMARKALKINEELTFSNEEIDQFLPEELKMEKLKKM